ncbi:sigma-70 family RNA polymerase sigma factor [Pedobacter sp. 22226]|uniref:sigma-70 family RNA polymerase sigma factor n=1 Tax=Pedobacter sp. 22226 TaxID=3453894 RepID=UPI003F85DF53
MSKNPGMKALRIEVSFTTREFHSLNLYFADLAKIDLLGEEEEVLLCKRIREGDSSAVERLVRGNLRFVVTCAKKYEHMGLPLGDLINEGNLGLIAAAGKFDETLGFKFISYAVYWIRQAMLLALGEHSRMVRLPMNQVRNITVAQQKMGELEQDLERTATVEELAEAVGVPTHQLAEQLHLDRIPLSIYQPQGIDMGDRQLCDIIRDESLMPTDYLSEINDRGLLIGRLLAALNRKERKVIEGLYGINCSMESSYGVVADNCGLTSERIKQIEKGAIKKLRELVGNRGIVNG